jgi:hypothetical protein
MVQRRRKPKRKPGRKKRPAVVRRKLADPVHLEVLQGHLQALHDAHDHPNRKLHMDHLVVAMLYAFYNPICRSLRMLEGLGRVCRDEIGVDQICRSTSSDALAVFDPQLLVPIIQDLQDRLPALGQADPDLACLVRQILAADGSYFNIYADVAWALHLTRSNGRRAGQVRLDVQLDVETGLPTDISVSGQAQGSETASVQKRLVPGAIYVVDRNFIDFQFLQSLLDIGCDFVLRCKSNAPGFAPMQPRPLSARDKADGVVQDVLGTLPGRGAPQRTFRRLQLRDPKTGQEIEVLTSLLDVPAYVVGVVYRKRWQVELFFRWLKVWGNLEHLISHSRNGLTIQFYVAVIGVLLTCLASGQRISKYAYGMLTFVASGQATLEDILPVLQKRERERQLERARLARKKAQQQQAS